MIDLYALVDPRDNNIRYIGYTTKPKARFRNHLNTCNKGRAKNTYKCRWISKLLKNNLEPLYKCLVQVENLEKAQLLEIELINHYKSFYKLTNTSPGGSGTTGLKWSEESKKRIKETRKNLIIPKKYKEVILTNTKTNEVLKFKTSKEASEYINCKRNSLTQCARGRRKSIKGYLCSYKEGGK